MNIRTPPQCAGGVLVVSQPSFFMPETHQRFEHLRRSIWLSGLLAVFGLVSLAVIAIYLMFVENGTGFGDYLLPVGILASAGVLGALFVFLWGLVHLLLKIEGNLFRGYGVLRDLETMVEKQQEDVKTISANAQLSDVVRCVTHHRREVALLHAAVNEEIIRGDWATATALVEFLESKDGYKSEAARLRAEVERSRVLDSRERLGEAVERIKAHMASHEWERARREMDRLIAANGDHEEVRKLPKLLERMRNDHKRRLLKAWDETVQRNEVDRGISILKELDQFLSPKEAAALEESARDVFKKKLHNLGVQFSLAVTGENWREAWEVGQQITREFPNSRMAQEVRERAHLLAKRVEGRSAEAIQLGAARD